MNEIYSTQYEITLLRAYNLYKRDWCWVRGYNPEEVAKANAKGEAYLGEMYVCLPEFEDCEFKDKEYMRYLLPPKDFDIYLEIMEE